MISVSGVEIRKVKVSPFLFPFIDRAKASLPVTPEELCCSVTMRTVVWPPLAAKDSGEENVEPGARNVAAQIKLGLS